MYKAKDPSEYGIMIPPEIQALVEKFDPNIKIKIKDTPKIYAQAPIITSNCIVLSKRLFELHDGNLRFTPSDVMVLVAHELGHIIPKSSFTVLFWVTFAGIATTCLFLPTKQFIYALLTIMLLLLWLGYISRKEEYNADSFAILKANISVDAFTQCFSKVTIILNQEEEHRTWRTFFKNQINKIFFNFHPSIEQRISKVRALHNSSKL